MVVSVCVVNILLCNSDGHVEIFKKMGRTICKEASVNFKCLLFFFGMQIVYVWFCEASFNTMRIFMLLV